MASIFAASNFSFTSHASKKHRGSEYHEPIITEPINLFKSFVLTAVVVLFLNLYLLVIKLQPP